MAPDEVKPEQAPPVEKPGSGTRLKGPVLKKPDRAPSEQNDDGGLTQDKLDRLHDLFEEMDEDGDGGGLEMDEFKNAMRHVMGNVTDKEIELLFMKVDANCDGSVEWDEYLSYMLQELQGKSGMQAPDASGLFTPEGFRHVASNHRDFVAKIIFVPNLHTSRGELLKNVDYSNGRYITAGRDGRFNFWTADMQPQRTFSVDNGKDVSPWITDVVSLSNVNMVCVSSTDRNVIFFDVSGIMFEKKYEIINMPYSPHAIDYWFDPKKKNVAILVIGDDGGNVSLIQFSDIESGPFGQIVDKLRGAPQVSFKDLLKGKYPTAKTTMYANIHRDWVSQVKFLPDLQCYISCDGSSDKSVYMGDLLNKKANYYFQVHKGVLCFDYCSRNVILVTGGQDHSVRIWNPYVPKRAVAVLTGHMDAVTHICLYSERDQCFTVSKDRNLRVYDVLDHSCLLNFQLKNFHTISAIAFNPKLTMLIVGSNELALFENNQEEIMNVKKVSHQAPVTCALYNSLFNVVVTACSASTISVWDLNTGNKLIQFKNAHTQLSGDCEEVGVEITSMQFDPTQRRMVTGARDGTVKVWNFNNGACLQDLDAECDREITGLCFARDRIIVCGWNRKVAVFVDGEEGEDEPPKIWDKRHKEDILSVDYFDPQESPHDVCIVATSSYDGDIYIWELETGHMMYRLNANDGTKPQPFAKPKAGRSSAGDLSSTAASSAAPSRADSRDAASDVGSAAAKPSQVTSLPPIGSRDHPDGAPSRPSSKAGNAKAGEPSSASTRDVYNRKHHLAVDKLLFMRARPQGKDTAQLFGSGSHGWVRAWSIHRDGGLLGQFQASPAPYGESVAAMCTDSKNEYLMTADSLGYVNVWDITEYCIADTPQGPEVLQERQARYSKFPFTSLGIQRKHPSSKFPTVLQRFEQSVSQPPAASRPEVTHKVPYLLNSFRAHTKIISSIDYVEERELLITASVDYSVRLWTLTGRFIGIFGQRALWSTVDFEHPTNHSMPDDIRREGSATTLKVLNAGGFSKWVARRRTLLALSHMRLEQKRRKEAELKELGLWQEENPSAPAQATRDQQPNAAAGESTQAAAASAEKDGRAAAAAAAAAAMGPPGGAAGRSAASSESREAAADKTSTSMPVLQLLTEANKSKYLGKTFKAPGKHRALPSVTIKHIENTNQIQVYPCLRFCDLTQLNEPLTVVNDIQQRYRLTYDQRRRHGGADKGGANKARPGGKSLLDTFNEMLFDTAAESETG